MKKPLPRNLAKITSIDRNNPEAHAVSLIWADAGLTINNFDLSVLGKVAATQGDLMTTPPRGWVILKGECQRRLGSSIRRA
jgi:hypothetical protein